jgi:hypothetical protein
MIIIIQVIQILFRFYNKNMKDFLCVGSFPYLDDFFNMPVALRKNPEVQGFHRSSLFV